jgi:hypothetical protein
VLLDLKAILTLVCLKRLVIFLIRGEVYVKVAHLVVTSLSACEAGWTVLCCICCFNVSINCSGMLLFHAVSNMVFHSLSYRSEVSGSVRILSM